MRALLVTALACEARPVIGRLRLRATLSGEGARPFRLYRREDVAVVVSGVGKVAAAAATAWAVARSEGGEPAVFVNFGCAGHGERDPGEVLLAHEIRDGASGRKWFPPLVFRPPGETSRVVTVDRPEEGFRDDALYEMEASGFVETACRFTSAELVHCLKFVSDNRRAPAAALDARRIEELADGALEHLTTLLAELGELAAVVGESRKPPEGYCEILDRWRFSVTQARQLRRLLQRWQALVPEEAFPKEALRAARSSREALEALRRRVEGEAGPPAEKAAAQGAET